MPVNTNAVRRTLDALAAAGWLVRESSSPPTPDEVLPPELRRRYPKAPREWAEFAARIEECTNADETAWFLTAADYAGTSGYAFEWNAWELLDLESSDVYGGVEGAAEVRAFWDEHLPFYLDVRGDYAYFAIRLRAPRIGSVVHGASVEFRATSEVASSFSEFLELLVAAVRDPECDGPLAGLV
jgi:hypothetical protein